jgi:hypothetical protein
MDADLGKVAARLTRRALAGYWRIEMNIRETASVFLILVKTLV